MYFSFIIILTQKSSIKIKKKKKKKKKKLDHDQKRYNGQHFSVQCLGIYMDKKADRFGSVATVKMLTLRSLMSRILNPLPSWQVT